MTLRTPLVMGDNGLPIALPSTDLLPAAYPGEIVAPHPIRRRGSMIWQSSFDDGTWEVVQNCTIADDTTHVAAGSKSLALTATGTVANEMRVQKTGLALDLSAANVWLRVRYYMSSTALAGTITSNPLLDVYLMDSANVSQQVNLGLGNVTNPNPSDPTTPGATIPYAKVGWNAVEVPLSNYSWTNGSLNRASIAKVAVGGYLANAQALTLDQIEFFTPAQTRGKIVVGFDGAYSAQWQAVAFLEKQGKRATFAVNPNYVGTAGHLTLAQLQELQARGHLIIGYAGGYYTPLWAYLTDAQKLDVVLRTRVWMAANGFLRGMRYLSISGISGWTANDDANLLGKYIDCVYAGFSDGLYTPSIMLNGNPRFNAVWFANTTTASGFLPSENWAAVCARTASVKGTAIMWAHLSGTGGDTEAAWEPLITTALGAGLEFQTLDQYMRDEAVLSAA